MRAMSESNCPRGTETSGTSLRKPQNSKRQNSFCFEEGPWGIVEVTDTASLIPPQNSKKQNSFCVEAGPWGIVEVTGRCCVAHSKSRIYVAVSSHLETPGESCPSGLEVRTLCWYSGAIRFEPCSSPDYCNTCSECWEHCQSRFTIHIFCFNFFRL
jgi:hypothetical protein